MLSFNELQNALEIQNRCFKLLQWLARAVGEGFISVSKAHGFADASHAVKAWVESHFYNLPLDCRPEPEQMEPFANFFGTYLETSFDLIANPADRYVSACGCSCCLYLAAPQYLKPKSLTRADKERAIKLRVRRLEVLAREEGLPFDESRLHEVLVDEKLLIAASLSAYGTELLDRLKGISEGPAVLALWRHFAWNRNGSPIRNFKLQASNILQAEQSLLSVLRVQADA